MDDLECAGTNVRNLSQSNLNRSKSQGAGQQNTNVVTDAGDELENKANQSCPRKFFNSIYTWDEDFHFTTMVICTYTVAIVFVYYLTCTFVFLYTTRTTGHMAFLKSYIESSANIGKYEQQLFQLGTF